jgi:hypothetical protein
MDWGQLWEIVSAPDNIPIVAMLFLVPFFTWYAMRQAVANDRLITELEGDSTAGQDSPSQDPAVAAGLGKGAACLAVPAAHRVSCGGHRARVS